MLPLTFFSLLEEAESLPDLARRLGVVCTENEAELKAMLEEPLLAHLADELAVAVANADPDSWAGAIERPQERDALLGPGLTGLLDRADPHYPVDCLAVLRGFCRRQLPVFYASVEGTVLLDRGAPVPFAPRYLSEGFEKTPFPERLNSNDLLADHGHRLFEYSAGEQVQVQLDFSLREELDALLANGRLPRVATIHPEGCGDLTIGTFTESEFFDAKPTRWDGEEILALLREVADVEVAVLPELSMQEAAQLGPLLAVEKAEMPSLIVAGSAHVREQGLRANEATIYLNREPVGAHRKCHPYIASRLENKKLEKPLGEALTSEQKQITVLSGDRTRLAVVICADLNDQYIPQKLLAAGVNTLIVPSFTPKKGAFNGPIADLAARCQGVSVIANAPPSDASTFHAMVAVPRTAPGEPTRSYPGDGEEPSRIAVFDPNEPLDSAVNWR